MKKIAIIILTGLCSAPLFAQLAEQDTWQENRDQFSVWAGGGLSTIQYSPALGDYTAGTGFIAGLGYDRFLNDKLSVGIGAEFSRLQSKSNIPFFSENYPVVDPTLYTGGGLFSLYIDGQDYRQKQSAYYINIPIIVRYHLDVWKHHKVYVGIGPKIGFPVKSTYTTQAALTTIGELLDADGTPQPGDRFEKVPPHGFTTYYPGEATDLKLRFNVIASIEAGMKWHINRSWGLYTGLFFDYGLNDIRKDFDKDPMEKIPHIYAYNPGNLTQVTPTYSDNSLLFSKTENIGERRNEVFAKRVNTVAFGVKVAVTFGIHPFSKKSKAAKPLPTPKDPWDEPVTGNQMKHILAENTGALVGAQREEFETLKKFLTPKDSPDLLIPITGFDIDKSDILALMHADLNRKVENLKKNPNTRVKLTGHTDDTGNEAHNYQLALDRAESVKAYLIVHGIQADRISIASRGASSPIVPNTNEVNRRYNRRVEVEEVK